MSLPFLLGAARVQNLNSSAKCKFRGGSSSKVEPPPRHSLDKARTSAVGTKRKPRFFEDADDSGERALDLRLELDPLPPAHFAAPERTRVSVIGLDSVAVELATCLASKPGLLQCTVVPTSSYHDTRMFDVMPGVIVQPCVGTACDASDVIVLAGSYKETLATVNCPPPQLRGKVVLQIGSGTPQDARLARDHFHAAGARYLDAAVLSQGGKFGQRGASLMVSGDRDAWDAVETLVKAAAPASFYGGNKPEWANTAQIGLFVFLASVQAGVKQALTLTDSFKLPRHVLPALLSGSFMPVVRDIVRSSSSRPIVPGNTAASTSSAGDAASSSMTQTPSVNHSVVSDNAEPREGEAPAFGSRTWLAQLHKIRDICREAGADHSIIEGMLAAAGTARGDAPGDSSVANLAIGVGGLAMKTPRSSCHSASGAPSPCLMPQAPALPRTQSATCGLLDELAESLAPLDPAWDSDALWAP